MKKITMTLVTAIAALSFSYGQAIFNLQAPPAQNANTPFRAPNGTAANAYMRACFLVQASELNALTLNSLITAFGFSLSSGTSGVACPGNFTVYLQNTNDASYLKGTTWSSVLTGMLPYYQGPMTIPISATPTTITMPLSPGFTFGGNALYVAYDWVSSGPFSATSASYIANVNLANGGATAEANIAPAPPTLTNSPSGFRPAFSFTATNTLSNDVQVLAVFAPGKVINNFNSPHTISAVVRNSSNTTVNNIGVNLNVTGANSTGNNVTIPTLAPGALTVVNLSNFNPQTLGINTISVSVASDQDNSNNTFTLSQNVNCTTLGVNPSTGTYVDGVGFNTNSGIITNKLVPATNATLNSVRLAVSSDANAVGKVITGVLLDAAGNIVATTNTITVNGGMAGNFQTLNFNPPQALTSLNDFYIGLAQQATPTGYFPLGAQPWDFIPTGLYYTAPLAGGTPNAITNNLGYFGIEPVLSFTNTIISATPTKSTICKGDNTTINVTGGGTTYTWSANTNTNTSVTSVVVTPTINTTYTVAGTDAGSGCKTNVASVTVLVSICTGLMSNGVAGSEIRVFPNPAVNGKTVISGLDGTNRIIVYNVLGQVVTSQTVNEESITVDLNGQPNGTYLVKILDATNHAKTVKIVNQN